MHSYCTKMDQLVYPHTPPQSNCHAPPPEFHPPWLFASPLFTVDRQAEEGCERSAPPLSPLIHSKIMYKRWILLNDIFQFSDYHP